MMNYRQQTRPVKSRFPFLVLPALALYVPVLPLQAEPLTFSKAVELAETATPSIEARSLVVEAVQSAAIAADQLPDPKLSVDILDRRIAGPFEFSPRPGRNGFPRQRIGISQDIPNGAKRRARAGQAMADITVARANKETLVQDVQLYSALVFHGPQLVMDIRRDLSARLKADGFSNIAEAVGTD